MQNLLAGVTSKVITTTRVVSNSLQGDYVRVSSVKGLIDFSASVAGFMNVTDGDRIQPLIPPSALAGGAIDLPWPEKTVALVKGITSNRDLLNDEFAEKFGAMPSNDEEANRQEWYDKRKEWVNAQLEERGLADTGNHGYLVREKGAAYSFSHTNTWSKLNGDKDHTVNYTPRMVLFIAVLADGTVVTPSNVTELEGKEVQGIVFYNDKMELAQAASVEELEAYKPFVVLDESEVKEKGVFGGNKAEDAEDANEDEVSDENEDEMTEVEFEDENEDEGDDLFA